MLWVLGIGAGAHFWVTALAFLAPTDTEPSEKAHDEAAWAVPARKRRDDATGKRMVGGCG
jgi:hypothetical protein